MTSSLGPILVESLGAFNDTGGVPLETFKDSQIPFEALSIGKMEFNLAHKDLSLPEVVINLLTTFQLGLLMVINVNLSTRAQIELE